MKSVWAVAGLVALAGCAEEPWEHEELAPGDALLASASASRVESQYPFRSAGLRWRGGEGLEARALLRDGAWSAWSPVEVTWREGQERNGSWSPPAPALALELRGASLPEPAYVELYGLPRRARRAAPLDAPSLRAVTARLAPAELVHSRQEWGARATSSCGTPHQPRYLTIHHTATPNGESDPKVRLRNIQAFHIDQRGWCDIGYHFLVSADGQIWQGRDNEAATGAHVGGHNTNNVGIGHLGTFSEVEPPEAMLDGTTRMIRWLVQTYDMTLDREHLRGHREWPDNSTECPGDRLFARLEPLIDAATDSPQPPPGLTLEAAWSGAPDAIKDGASDGVPDLWEGASAQLQVLAHNPTDGPLPLRLAFAAASPWLQPTRATLALDQGGGFAPLEPLAEGTDADLGALADQGVVNLGAIPPGATARLTVEVQGQLYSFGQAPFDGLRLWAQAGAEGFDAAATRAEAPLHVWSPSRWEFSGAALPDTEGWAACNGDLARAAINSRDGALALEVAGPEPCVDSPPGAPALDAARHPEARLRVRHYNDLRRVSRLSWRAAGEGFDPARAVTAETVGDGQWHDLTLDLSAHPQWRGQIAQLRLEPYDGAPGENPWFDVDYLRLPEADVIDADGDGAPEGVDCDDADPARAPGLRERCDGIDNDCDGLTDEPPACPPADPNNGATPGDNNGAPGEEDGDPEPTPDEQADDAARVLPGTQVREVCAAAPAGAPHRAPTALLLLATLALLTRRPGGRP